MVLVLADLYQRIQDSGVDEFADLDGKAQASLIRRMASDLIRWISDNIEGEREVFLLGLKGSRVTKLNQKSLNKVTEHNASEFYDDGFIQFALSDPTANDWKIGFMNLSGDLDCIISVIGKHPNYDGIIKQGYEFGKFGEGMISDKNAKEFLNNETWVKQYNTWIHGK